MAMNTNAARFLVQTAGNNHRQAKNRVKETRKDLKRDVVLARKHGLSITEISAWSGIPRTNIYALLDEDAREND